MLVQKILGFVLALGLANSAYSDGETPETPNAVDTTYEIGMKLAKSLPSAAAEALTLDLPTLTELWVLQSVSGVPGKIIPYYVVAAFVAQVVRTNCKDYLTDGNPSVLCGAIAGITKYGLRGALVGKSGGILLEEFAKGAADIGKYEYDRARIVEAFKRDDAVEVASIVFYDEIFNFVFAATLPFVMEKIYNRASKSILPGKNDFFSAFLVPFFLTVNIYTFNSYLGKPIADVIEAVPSYVGAVPNLVSGLFTSSDEHVKKEL